MWFALAILLTLWTATYAQSVIPDAQDLKTLSEIQKRNKAIRDDLFLLYLRYDDTRRNQLIQLLTGSANASSDVARECDVVQRLSDFPDYFHQSLERWKQKKPTVLVEYFTRVWIPIYENAIDMQNEYLYLIDRETRAGDFLDEIQSNFRVFLTKIYRDKNDANETVENCIRAKIRLFKEFRDEMYRCCLELLEEIDRQSVLSQSILEQVKAARENGKGALEFEYQGVSFKFIYIPPGEYDMGLTSEQCRWLVDSSNNFTIHANVRKRYRIHLEQGFFIQEDEFSNEQAALLDSALPANREPYVDVDWQVARQVGERLFTRLDLNAPCAMRLPTEIEWECAARFPAEGTDGELPALFPWGNDCPDLDSLEDKTKLGVKNMGSSVSEFCLDEYRRYFFSLSTQPDIYYFPYGREFSSIPEYRYAIENNPEAAFVYGADGLENTIRTCRGGNALDIQEKRYYNRAVSLRRCARSNVKNPLTGFRLVWVFPEDEGVKQ